VDPMTKPVKPKPIPMGTPVGTLTPLEMAVWAAEFVQYRAARMDSTKQFPPLDEDIDDAMDNANEVIIELRNGFMRWEQS
jgi:hypothetical protein